MSSRNCGSLWRHLKRCMFPRVHGETQVKPQKVLIWFSAAGPRAHKEHTGRPIKHSNGCDITFCSTVQVKCLRLNDQGRHSKQ